jgi:hypothetical protein
VAIDARQHHIQNHQIDRMARQHRPHGLPIARGVDNKIEPEQVLAKSFRDLFVAINDKDMRLRIHGWAHWFCKASLVPCPVSR